MAGLLAWAADVVGAGGGKSDEDDKDNLNSIPLILTPDQQTYVRELDHKAASLSRSIQDLRLRVPPSHISQRLPHLHAHSLASNAALSLQLNSHSSTKQQTQLREVTLQEENAEYEKAISNCENKIRDRLQEADVLRSKLEEMDLTENKLKIELENAQTELCSSQSGKSSELLIEAQTIAEAHDDTEALKFSLLEKTENKKKELVSLEEIVQGLEKKWTEVQENTLKQPSPGQREKMLDRQVHSQIGQLAAKQDQAEGIVSEIRLQEIELERLNELRRILETSTTEVNIARNRFGRSSFDEGPVSLDYIVDPRDKPPYHMGGRTEKLQRLMLLRSAFVVYILVLHILVFIKISF